LQLRSRSPDATRAAGRLLGRVLGQAGQGATRTGVHAGPEGGVIALEGPLGAGKTLFVKGLAEGLGLPPEQVSSPTFVIANEYPIAGGGVLAHIDLYRLESQAELESTGYLDWLAPGNVVAVEWSDRLPEALPADRLTLRFAARSDADPDEAGGSQRRLNAIASGPDAEDLLARWRAAIADPAVEGLEISPSP